jgi:hypothetical protein
MACAEQLSPKERMFQILYRAFKKFIDSVQVKPQKRKRSAYGVSLIQVLHLLAIWLVTGPAAAAP